MRDVKEAFQRQENIADKAFHDPVHPYRKILENEGPKWSAWYAGWISFSVAMNTGLGAALNSIGYAAVAGAIGTVGVVSGVLLTLSYVSYVLFARDYRQHIKLTDRITRDKFTNKIMESSNVKSERMAAAHVLFSRAIACYTTTEDKSEPSLFKKPFIIDDIIHKNPNEVAGQYNYLLTLATEMSKLKGINFWFKAARAAGLDPYVLDTARRGLSEKIYSNRLAEGRDRIMEDASWKQKGLRKCPDRSFVNPDEDVPFFCLSYKHEDDVKPLNADELLGALRKAAVLAEKLYGKKCFRIWVDQLVFGSTQGWVGIGLMPYLLFPTVFASRAERSTSSSWICMEKVCSQVIVGGDLRTEPWKSTARSNTLLESISAVAEVVSKQEEGISTIRADDLKYLHSWAKGVLYGKEDVNPFQAAHEELGQRWNLSRRKKMHYIALFSLVVNNNSVLRHYYSERTYKLKGRDSWNIKHIFFDANPKVDSFDAVEKVTKAMVAHGAADTLVLVTEFSNLNMYTRLNVKKWANDKLQVVSIRAISGEQAAALGVHRDEVEFVDLERLR
ncbi:hypothetical protein FGB62_44g129 [Gracilaria domingensis]|nr:hypothetical protein FGB62_44g129 [Gracilaria domingensis]